MEIKIDMSELRKEVEDLSHLQVNTIAKDILHAVVIELYRNWMDEAKKQLHATRFQYTRSLQIVDISEYRKAIVLNGKLPNMVESGCSAFDLKLGFEKSSKVKYNKNGGWYLTIPFRFGTPGIVGESEVFTDILPKEIYDLVRKKESQITSVTGTPIQAAVQLAASEIPAPYDKLGIRKEVSDQLDRIYGEYQHKSSIYAGVQKSLGIYEKAQQGSYNSFRRVGKNSDPLSWIHSGIKAYNLADEALKNTDVDTISNNVIDKYLNDI